jgi:hypothetical protein
MTTKTKTKPDATAEAKQSGPRPTHRAWIVTDAADPQTGEVKPLWTEMTGLWPTKSSTGLSGPLTKPLPLTSGGRLVILPATVKHPA